MKPRPQAGSDILDVSPPGMCLIEGGVFSMGSAKFYPEEAPVRRIRVKDFWIDVSPVTNREFAAFADATGYRNCARSTRLSGHEAGARASGVARVSARNKTRLPQ